MSTEAIQEFLKQPTDFDELISKLTIVEESAVRAAAEQPTLFVRAARARVQTMRTLMAAEAAHDQLEAQKAQEIRQSGIKVTEGSVKEMLLLDADLADTAREVRRATAQEELGKLLIEAYKHRRDAIRIIAEANIIEGNSQLNEFDRQNASRKLSKDTREALRLKRVAAVEERE